MDELASRVVALETKIKYLGRSVVSIICSILLVSFALIYHVWVRH